ncbi:MAG: short-chain fatty acid transporter [Syntrophales bacterium]
MNESNTPKEKETILSRLTGGLANWALRWIPDAMIFALALTVIVFLAAWGLTSHGPVQLVDDWVKGFWVLLTFAMQMSLLMITGFTVADSKYVKRGLIRLVDFPKTKTQVIVFFSLFIGILYYLHWGVGMMAAIIMGREFAVRKRGLGLHYPFIASLALCSGIVVANGPSMAAQLLMATPGHFMEKVAGIIPLSQSTFDIKLLITNGLLYLLTPFLLVAIAPRKEHAVEIDDATAATFVAPPEKLDDKKILTPAERWDRSWFLPLLIALAGLFWIGKTFYTKGAAALDLNTLNFAFLILGLLLHGSAKSYVESVQRGTVTVYGVIIQFPLYAGIFGMISFSGLAQIIANFFISISTHGTYAWVIFIYTGVVDFFVPSGGSKFVIEAPYILPAAKALSVSAGDTINAYTAGSLWVNMVQPFWALPILGAFKLKFQDIAPFCLIIATYYAIIVSICLLVLPKLF